MEEVMQPLPIISAEGVKVLDQKESLPAEVAEEEQVESLKESLSNLSVGAETRSRPQPLEPTKSSPQNTAARRPVGKSHIWASSKGRHIAERCFLCHHTFKLSSVDIVKKCRLCRFRAHQECVLSFSDSKGCIRPHELLIYDKDHLDSRTPLIVFINPKSGAQAGNKLYNKFCNLLGNGQVFDLSKGGPEPGLKKYFEVKNLRVLVAGGDGTVSWVLESITKMQFACDPPVAILPLGTGNDLARQFGWGGGYDTEKLLPILLQIAKSKIARLDRWRVNFLRDRGMEGEDEPRIKIMNNYLSIGTDADIACGFHERRTTSPHLFTSRLVNKMWYTYEGTKVLTKAAPKLRDLIDLEIDGERYELQPDLEGLMILNLQNYAGGQNLWGDIKNADVVRLRKRPTQARSDDGLLEIVGVRGLIDVGTAVSGLHKPRKIGQALAVQITFKKVKNHPTVSVQIDGEPWREPTPFTMKICILDQTNVLCKTS
eukprot:TRINITY_DN8265_c0_g1_i1.p1 TRINITY_DN8265_c0_g1~~TRINITY_DN8265_c0_g1_i1.p1  ORF type:complete len:485 (-),score=78.44 TRINITY_DN8265_c0_g1_i1:27-1481(-)